MAKKGVRLEFSDNQTGEIKASITLSPKLEKKLKGWSDDEIKGLASLIATYITNWSGSVEDKQEEVSDNEQHIK